MSTKGKKLFELITGLRYFGVGSKVTRSIYRFPETYWEITRVNIKPGSTHGKAYGRLVWRGRVTDKEEEIRCPRKDQWSMVAYPPPNFTPK